MTETLLEAKSISKKYEDEYVLQNTDLKIDQRQFCSNFGSQWLRKVNDA